jgi:hypothetical protein
VTIKVVTYRLRGGQLQPRSSSCGGGSSIDGFFTQTFGAEKIVVDIDEAKTEILASTDFQGQKPTTSPLGIEDQTYIDSTYSRASYQGKALRTTDGELVYAASEEHVAQFIDESDLGTA